MKVGDLVWSLSSDTTDTKRRLAIIIEVDNFYVNPYVIQLVVSGFEGRTSERYLEPVEEV